MDEEGSGTRRSEMHDSFWHIIRGRFDKTNGTILTILIGFLSYVASNFSSIYMGVAVFIGLILLILTWTFYRAADDLYYKNLSLKNAQNHLPSVINVRKTDSALALCLLNPSDLFSYNALVTFYDYHKNFEQAIGFGEVVNIQEDGIIQVELTRILKGHEAIWEKLIQNHAECLKRIHVKPIILKRYLNQLREGGS